MVEPSAEDAAIARVVAARNVGPDDLLELHNAIRSAAAAGIEEQRLAEVARMLPGTLRKIIHG